MESTVHSLGLKSSQSSLLLPVLGKVPTELGKGSQNPIAVTLRTTYSEAGGVRLVVTRNGATQIILLAAKGVCLLLEAAVQVVGAEGDEVTKRERKRVHVAADQQRRGLGSLLASLLYLHV